MNHVASFPEPGKDAQWFVSIPVSILRMMATSQFFVKMDNKLTLKKTARESVSPNKMEKKQAVSRCSHYAICLVGVFLLFFSLISDFNPAKISLVGSYNNISLFTSAISYGRLTASFLFIMDRGFVTPTPFIVLMSAAALIMAGTLATVIAAVMSFGGKKKQKIASWFPLAGAVAIIAGLAGIYISYSMMINLDAGIYTESVIKDDLMPSYPLGANILFAILAVALLIFSVIRVVLVRITPETAEEIKNRGQIPQKYKLFLYVSPIIVLVFVFAYLPLYGWRYAFFNYEAGMRLTSDIFVGFGWFKTLFFDNTESLSNLVRALRNTLVMSGLGIATSWFPMMFAVLFSELKNGPFRRIVQTTTTLPNFISWVLIYAVALALFNSEGFLNSMIYALTGKAGTTNVLGQTGVSIWFQMLLWGVWKGVGWSAIIYIAAISSIDQGLYEAASIDGAQRFRKMWHITIPAILPTYSVMLLLSIAGILSNGLEQYLVFQNPFNQSHIEVLDLYIYNWMFTSTDSTKMIPYTTVLSMLKSLISIALLFAANWSSKFIRGESII